MQQNLLFGIIGIIVIGLGGYFVWQFTQPQQVLEGDGTTTGTIEQPMGSGGAAGTVETGNPDAETMGPAGEQNGSQTGGPTVQTYTLAQVAAHNSPSDCWTAINGSVYNLTSFVGSHPGGAAILKICGTDGTATFMAQHNAGAQQMTILATLKVGVLAQ